MIFSYNWLKDYIEGKVPEPKKLTDLITLHSFEVSEVKKIGRDWILDIDILPNRVDCLCHLGIAREIGAILGRKLNILKKEKLVLEKKKEILPINLKIKCPSLVPRYSAIIMTEVKIGPSPAWLREKLQTIGVRSINNIVDLTNFVMHELGQPLHPFDYDKILQQRMILRKSKKGEKVITLDDTERILNERALVIEDKKRLIDLVGIMGGKLSEIDSKTKNVVFQAGNFDRRTIYRTTKEVNQTTDASNIYSRGIDPNLTIPALERIHFLLKKLGDGKIVQIIDFYPQKVFPKKIKLDLDYVKNLLGIEIPKKEIINILKRLNFKIKEFRSRQLEVEVPTFRLDLSLPEDLIEEIGRIYGYQRIPSVFPVASLIPPRRNLDIFWEKAIRNTLKELGFTEVYNYSFVPEGGKIEVENPMSSKYKYLRPSLIPGLLKNIEKNSKYFKRIKIFEIGKVFKKTAETRMLGASLYPSDFYFLKGVVHFLLKKLGISGIRYVEKERKLASIKVNRETLGVLGENVFELDFEKLKKYASEEQEYWPISKYPSAVRDISVIVPQGILVVKVLNKINVAGGPLVRDIDLFDIYGGNQIPPGKKNLSFHIIYQARDRTLSSQEIDKIHKKIIKALEKNPEWRVRKY